MLRAAFTSALHRPALQASHSKTAWLLRFSWATCPHAEHGCDVYAAGSARSDHRPCLATGRRKTPTAAVDRPVQPTFLSNPHTGSLRGSPRSAGHRARRGLRSGSCRSVARCQWWPFRPSLCAGRSHEPQLRDRPFRARAPVGAALRPGEPPLQHFNRLASPDSGQEREAVHRSTGPPTRQHPVDTHHAVLPRTREGSGT